MWTHNKDGCWYSDDKCEAEGWFSSAYPAHLEIWLKNTNNSFTENELYEFLIITQKHFHECQLWLILNSELKSMMIKLKNTNKIDWEIIDNPSSESARIRYIANYHSYNYTYKGLSGRTDKSGRFLNLPFN